MYMTIQHNSFEWNLNLQEKKTLSIKGKKYF